MSSHGASVAFVVGASWALASGLPALADDTELFVGRAPGAQARPNILFVIDNSGTMGALVATQERYDGAVVYPAAGGCDANRVYWRTSTGEPPTCDTNNYFDLAALTCERARIAFATAGHYTDVMAQWDPSSGGGGRRWEAIAADRKDDYVECRSDHGVHGNGDAADRWARAPDASGAPWGNESQALAWSAAPANHLYTLYSGNYLSWAQGPTVQRSRLAVVQDVARDVLATISGVNVGLAHFNRNTSSSSNGGRIAFALEDVETARASLQAAIDALTPDGATPLTETLYEAAQYYLGGPVTYGFDGAHAARAPNDASLYQSPIVDSCQKSFIVLLTDGEPARDEDANGMIAGLADFPDDTARPPRPSRTFPELTGTTCAVEPSAPELEPAGGECLAALAEFLAAGDLSPLPGRQTVSTYTVGFAIDSPLLVATAERGAGRYYTAGDTATLANALTSTVTSILAEATTFTAPAVAVNAFNRTQSLNDLFVSVFRPSGTAHWPGNLKQYRVRAPDSAIVDASVPPRAAVDPTTGFFYADVQSGWSGVVDGAEVERGGAASLLPAWPNRSVYTHLAGNPLALTHPSNRIDASNMTDALLGLEPGDPPAVDVVAFINNLDTADADADGRTDDARNQMGDALHSQPAAVVYGPGLRDGLVFTATNDGVLHAVGLDDGVERWAFIPPELLPLQTALFNDEAAAAKRYGIDGELRVQLLADDDGVIDAAAGEKVYLFFGMGRGGDFYYALDVSRPAEPALLWRLDGSVLAGLGQTWSAPTPTRVNVGGVDHWALVLGGGYEPDQDDARLSTDTIGNSIYIVDSASGELLWHGGKAGAHARFAAAGRAMDYSIPAPVRVVDLDGDSRADRMYAADMGGQVWRFDIHNGAPAEALVSGGVIARLGGAPAATPAAEDTRRFYNAPDAALIETPYGNFVHVGIGSGHRGHPLNSAAHDAFYALRDYHLRSLSQSAFDALAVIEHDDLVPVTSASPNVPYGARGWRLDLNLGGWNGEKVLAEARTFSNHVIFSTFEPSTSRTSCEPQPGIARTYVLSAYDGAPVLNLDGEGDSAELTLDDVFVESAGGIPPTAQALFLDRDGDGDGIADAEDDSDGDGLADASDDDDDGDGVADEPGDADGEAVVCVGLRCFMGLMSNDPIRTVWSQDVVE